MFDGKLFFSEICLKVFPVNILFNVNIESCLFCLINYKVFSYISYVMSTGQHVSTTLDLPITNVIKKRNT